jgi:uncharacterized protein YkwD
MNDRRCPAWFVTIGLVLLAGCGEPKSSPTLGTNSNWFVTCRDDGQCSGSARCECTRCTRTCSADTDCSGLGDARCAISSDASSLSQCRADRPAGICLARCVHGSCAEDEACVAGSCVSNALPDDDFCAGVAPASAEDRTREDDLFELVQAMRAAGGVSCGSNPSSIPASAPLRSNASLTCAARVLAADLDATGNLSLIDSSGRGTGERLQAAGYAANLWAESFALASASANDALAVMLADTSSCTGLTRAGYVELGVAHVGRAYVATLGSE